MAEAYVQVPAAALRTLTLLVRDVIEDLAPEERAAVARCSAPSTDDYVRLSPPSLRSTRGPFRLDRLRHRSVGVCVTVPVRICEGIMPGLVEAWRQQAEHFRDHDEPDPTCWFCTHRDGSDD